MPETPRRIGFIIPSANRVLEREVTPRLPPDCLGHVTRLRMSGPHWTPLDKLLPRAAEAAAALTDAGCGTVMFNCTASSMEQGVAGNAALMEALRGAVGEATASTTATAVAAALQALGARRIVLVTPYSPAVTARASAFLEQSGFEVLNSVARDLSGKGPYWDITPAQWQADLRAARDPRAEAYVLSCANISCLDMIEDAEAELGAPVVTTNQAVMWQALKAAGAAAMPAGLGALAAL